MGWPHAIAFSRDLREHDAVSTAATEESLQQRRTQVGLSQRAGAAPRALASRARSRRSPWLAGPRSMAKVGRGGSDLERALVEKIQAILAEASQEPQQLAKSVGVRRAQLSPVLERLASAGRIHNVGSQERPV